MGEAAWQLTIDGVTAGSVIAGLAVGLSLVYGTSRVFNFAYGAVFAVAAYGLYAARQLGGLPIWLGAILASLAAVAFAVAVEVVLLRPLARRQAPALVSMVATTGVYICAVNALAMGFGNETLAVQSGVQSTIAVAGARVTVVRALEACLMWAMLALLAMVLAWSPLGRQLRATADNSVLAEALGADVMANRLRALVVGAIFAAVGGSLAAVDVGLQPHMGIDAFLVAVVAMILGGASHLAAVAIGGLALGILQSVAGWLMPSTWQPAVTFGVLIAVLALRPRGLGMLRVRVEEA